MSDYSESHSASMSHHPYELCVSAADEILFTLRLSLPDDISEGERRKNITSSIRASLCGESYSRGCCKLVVQPKLETHLVVLILPIATNLDSNGGISYHQQCCLVRAESPLTKSQVLNSLGLVCSSLLGVSTVSEVSYSWEHVEHAESGGKGSIHNTTVCIV